MQLLHDLRGAMVHLWPFAGIVIRVVKHMRQPHL